MVALGTYFGSIGRLFIIVQLYNSSADCYPPLHLQLDVEEYVEVHFMPKGRLSDDSVGHFHHGNCMQASGQGLSGR